MLTETPRRVVLDGTFTASKGAVVTSVDQVKGLVPLCQSRNGALKTPLFRYKTAWGFMMKSSRNLVGLFAFVAVAALAVAGCAHHDRNANYIEDQPGGAFGEVVAQRASFDLSCPSDKIQIQGIGGDSFGASGCERKASYTCVCMWHVWSTCTKPVCALDGISAPAAAANANAKTSEPAITYSAPPTAK